LTGGEFGKLTITIKTNMEASKWIGGSATGTTVAQLIFRPVAALAHALFGFEVTSDKAASVIAFLTGGAPVSLTTAADASATALVVGSTAAAGFAANDEIYIYNTATKTGQIRVVSSVSGGTVTVSAGVTGASAIASTRIHKLTRVQSIKVGAATKALQVNVPIFVGGVNRPLVVRVDGTSACAIGHLSGELIK